MNTLYRRVDQPPRPMPRPPIYGVGGFDLTDPASYLVCEYYTVELPTPGGGTREQQMRRCPPLFLPQIVPARPPETGYGSSTTSTPPARPPSTGGGGGQTAGCPASRPHYICWDYYIDPMRPERGTARECMCVTGVTRQ